MIEDWMLCFSPTTSLKCVEKTLKSNHWEVEFSKIYRCYKKNKKKQENKQTNKQLILSKTTKDTDLEIHTLTIEYNDYNQAKTEVNLRCHIISLLALTTSFFSLSL